MTGRPGHVRAVAGFLAAAACLLPPAVHAMDPAKPLAHYRRDAWGAEEGFPGGAVFAIAQDVQGYLWLGTERGLVRFDGASFRLVADPGTRGPAAQVLGVLADDQGLWLRLDRPHVRRYREGRFEDVPFAQNPREVAVTAMVRGEDGRPLVYSQIGGLLAESEGQLVALAADTIPSSLVIAMAQAKDGTVWMGTRDAGLFRLHEGRITAVREGLPDRKVNCLLAADGGELWVGTDRGIVRWTGTELTREGLPRALQDVQALALLRDRDGNVWVGTGHGLVRVRGMEVSTREGGLAHPGRPVTALFEDRDGDLWVGGGDGIERLRDTAFTTYHRVPGLLTDEIGPVYADGSERVWFAPAAGGLYWREGDEVRRVAVPGLASDLVYSIARASDGLWLGGQRTGLTHLRPHPGGGYRAVSYTRADGLPQDGVYSVHEARDRSVWAGTLSGGLARRRDGRTSTFTTADGLAANTVAAILDTADGVVWAATPSGLCAFQNGGWRTYGVADGLPSANVTALLEDGEGLLWVGTAQGLAFLRGGSLASPGTAPEALQEPVRGLAEGEAGWLWVATAHRVLRVRRTALLAGTVGEADLVTYGPADGLLGTDGVRRHRSVAADGRGRVFFSTSRGLAVVDSQRAIAPSAPPPVHVREMTTDGRPTRLQEPVRLPPRPQRVSFAFAGVSLSAPERVRYRYRLDGFDRGWSLPTAVPEAAYTNLAPGPYRFRVAASAADGRFEGPEATVSFSIATSPWQSWWFQVGAALAAAGLARGLYLWRLGQATRRLRVLFEERLAERTRIARELHDTLLQGVLSASMQLHVAAEQVPESSPSRALLARVQRLMGQVVEEGRNTLRGLRAADPASLDLAEALSRVRQDLAAEGAPELRVVSEGPGRPLQPAVRAELYRIGREALVNAYLHARAGRVEVELEYGEREMRLLVRDDGVGIDPLVLREGREGHFGLSGMRERAEKIGGRLRLWSAPGAGTEVELVVRGSVAFADAAPSRFRGWLERLGLRSSR